MSNSTVSEVVACTDRGITYNPQDAWTINTVAGETATLFVGDETGLRNGYITYTFDEPAFGFEYWGYQRPDGGLFSVCFDCPDEYTDTGDPINFLNASANATDSSVLLYSNYELSYGIHNVTISNLVDARATYEGNYPGGYGQLSVDRFVLISLPNSTTTSDSSSSSVPGTTRGVGASSESSLTSAAAPLQTSKPSSYVGAIAGGVCGGIVALALNALLLWFLLFRAQNRRRAAPVTYGISKDSSPSATTPFLRAEAGCANEVPAMPAPRPRALPRGLDPWRPPQSLDGDAGRPLAAGRPPNKSARYLSAPPVTRHPGLPPSAGAYLPNLHPTRPASGIGSPPAQRDEDAGFLQGDEHDAPILPPDYNAAWARRPTSGLV
ncbi:hypothetical protein CALCODRAFT_558385 [Calocera cornea HHB12733]|uniref:Uncharacterized protein n=1 Tax=Calocera cornea HHB12733 TaxID=1353952 RepID=A0A165D1F5_9BASI|nr:hypothetical protein CALCODRAFT_558385 [Calocera cornea HHB12733]